MRTATTTRTSIARRALAALALTGVGIGLVAVAVPDTANAAVVTHTQRTVIRPVRANGTPAPGYRVIKADHGLGNAKINCDSMSPSAVDPNIRECTPTAAGAIACWKSSKHTALCLADIRKKKLVRYTYEGSFGSGKAPKNPAPYELDLRSGPVCTIRFGGAWPLYAAQPNWFGQYWCSNSTAVYGPNKDHGIVKSFRPWLVHVVTFHPHSDTMHEAGVARAYYVGTAR